MTLPFVLAFLFVVAAAGVKWWQNLEASNQLKRAAAQHQAVAAYINTFQMQLGNFHRKQDIEARLNGGIPIATKRIREPWLSSEVDVLEEGIIVEPATGAEVRIQFLNGTIIGLRPSQQGKGPAGKPFGWYIGEELRQQVLIVGPTLWVLGLITASLIWHRLRPVQWVSGMLLISLAWLAAGLLGTDTFASRKHFWMRMEYWIWALLTVGVTALWLRYLLRAPRDWTKCGTCGYDLTGNVSGSCPECGTVIPPRPSAEDVERRMKLLAERIEFRRRMIDGPEE